jgi:hypothetical protein
MGTAAKATPSRAAISSSVSPGPEATVTAKPASRMARSCPLIKGTVAAAVTR